MRGSRAAGMSGRGRLRRGWATSRCSEGLPGGPGGLGQGPQAALGWVRGKVLSLPSSPPPSPGLGTPTPPHCQQPSRSKAPELGGGCRAGADRSDGTNFSPRATPRATERQSPAREVRPPADSASGTQRRGSGQGKGHPGTRLRGRRTTGSREGTEASDGKYASRPTGDELVDAEAGNAPPPPRVAFPSLFLTLIFLVYPAVSTAVLC